MKLKSIILSIILVFGAFLAGCNSETTTDEKASNDSPEKIQVYTTVYPLQFLAERIGGDFVQAQSIYPAGADEHTFEPSQKDMMNLADADLFFYIGLGLEGFVNKAEDILQKENVTMVATAEAIEEIHSEDEHSEEEQHSEEEHVEDTHSEDEHSEEEHAEDTHSEDEHSEEEHTEDTHSNDEHSEEGTDEHNHGGVDPHVWLNPLYMIDLAEEVKNSLTNALPEQKDLFEQNYQTLKDELTLLDQDFEKVIATAATKEMIVSHSAYGYWEKRYGIEQISISGISTANEPSQKELKEIIDTAKEHGLKYIFVEQNVSSKLSETVKTEINGEILSLHNLSTLTDQDLKNDLDYIEIMKSNLETIKKALN